MTEFFNELNRLRTDKAPDAGTGRCQAYDRRDVRVVARESRAGAADAPSRSSATVCRPIIGTPIPQKIAAITADDVVRVAKKYINPDNAQIVVVGDASKIKAIMEKYGPVTVYDTEGKEIAN